MNIFAGILLLAGLGAGMYFLVYFDTTVEVPGRKITDTITIPGTRVNNIGLMNDRQNGINLGFGAAVVGLILLVIQHRKKSS